MDKLTKSQKTVLVKFLAARPGNTNRHTRLALLDRGLLMLVEAGMGEYGMSHRYELSPAGREVAERLAHSDQED